MIEEEVNTNTCEQIEDKESGCFMSLIAQPEEKPEEEKPNQIEEDPFACMNIFDDEEEKPKNEPIVDLNKLSKDSFYSMSKFDKGNCIYKNDNPSEIFKIVNLTDRDDINKIKVTAKSEKNNIVTLTIKNYHEFSQNKNVKIVLINYLNNIFELNVTFDMNISFAKLKEEICKMYSLDEECIAVIFKDKRKLKNELTNLKLCKDFDFEKDFILMVQSKNPMDLVEFTTCIKSDRSYKQNEKRKSIFLFHENVKVKNIFFAKNKNDGNEFNILNFEIWEIDENPINYYKLKKDNKDLCENYNVDSLFNKLELENIGKANLIYSDINIPIEKHSDDEKSDSFYSSMKSNFFLHKLNTEINFLSDKFYLIKLEISPHKYVKLVQLKKNKMTFLSDRAVPVSIFLEKKQTESYVCGFEFRQVTLFEI